MTFDTDACKNYIVQYIKSHPGCIIEIFDDPEAEPDEKYGLEPGFEDPALIVENWKRRVKYKEGKNTISEFENRAYEYTVCATIEDDGSQIIRIDFSAE